MLQDRHHHAVLVRRQNWLPVDTKLRSHRHQRCGWRCLLEECRIRSRLVDWWAMRKKKLTFPFYWPKFSWQSFICPFGHFETWLKIGKCSHPRTHMRVWHGSIDSVFICSKCQLCSTGFIKKKMGVSSFCKYHLHLTQLGKSAGLES